MLVVPTSGGGLTLPTSTFRRLHDDSAPTLVASADLVDAGCSMWISKTGSRLYLPGATTAPAASTLQQVDLIFKGRMLAFPVGTEIVPAGAVKAPRRHSGPSTATIAAAARNASEHAAAERRRAHATVQAAAWEALEPTVSELKPAAAAATLISTELSCPSERWTAGCSAAAADDLFFYCPPTQDAGPTDTVPASVHLLARLEPTRAGDDGHLRHQLL
jgi:hypothetical protein